MKATIATAFWIACLGALLTTASHAQPVETLELRVKAAQLFNFPKFIEWPEDSFERDDSPFIFAIIGRDAAFAEILQETLKDKTLKGRRIEFRQYQRLEELEAVHALYISEQTEAPLDDIVRKTRELSVLTVSDEEGYARQGVMINFYRAENRIRFEINLKAAEQQNLKMDSRLLGLARIVQPESTDNSS